MARPKKAPTTEIAVPVSVPAVVVKKELILEGDPVKQFEFARKAATTLMSWVEQKPKKVLIRGEQYLEFGDWQILGRFYGSFVGIEWTRPIMKGDKVWGYEARAFVQRGEEKFSPAEGMCTRDEKRWATADEYAIRSMAQTRTSAKALRNAFGWVAELAGMKSTPAEEMDGSFDRSTPAETVPTVYMDDHEETSPRVVPKPWAKKPQDPIVVLKTRIKELADKKVLAPLATAEEYVEWVNSQTGLNLKDQTESNLTMIVERLEALQ